MDTLIIMHKVFQTDPTTRSTTTHRLDRPVHARLCDAGGMHDDGPVDRLGMGGG